MPSAIPGVDFARLFAELPGRYLVLMPDAPRFTIVAASEAYLDSTGTVLSEIVGRGLFEVFPGDTKADEADGPRQLRASLARVLSTGRTDRMPTLRYDTPGAGGDAFEERYWTPTNSLVRDAGGNPLYLVHDVKDSTDLVLNAAAPEAPGAAPLEERLRQAQSELVRQSEELRRSNRRLADSEHRYRSMLSNMPGVVFRAEAAPPWNLVYASDGIDALTGYPVSWFMAEGNRLSSLMHPDDVPRVTAEIAAQRQAGQDAIRVEYRIRHRDGRWRWVESRGRSAEDARDRVDGTLFDIDERKRAELALLESEEHFRHTVGSVPSLLWTARADGRLEFISEAAGRLLGIAPQSLVEDGWIRVLHPDDQDARMQEWRAAVIAGEPFETRLRMRVASGDYHTFQNQARPRRDEQGRIVRWYGATYDIEELEKARARAEQAARARSAFLSAMSHEIRTPLNAVIGFAGLLADTELKLSQRDFVNSIRASGDHLLRVINDILDFSKLESGSLALSLAPCRPRALIASALQLVAHQATQRKLQLRGHVEPDVPAAFLADEDRLRQILVNLLGNGVKFTPTGSVDVHVRALHLHGDEHEFEFRVRDTGIGIPADRLDRLFQDFSQVDDSIARRFGGTGLGLAISKRLVEAHGGTLAVESAPGTGSTFIVRIPARAVDPPAEAPSEDGLLDEADAAAIPPMRLLLVEDNLVNRKVALLVLRKLGYHDVDTAIDGVEALGALATRDYDVVLMDVQMPVLDGLSCTRRIRAELPAERQPQIIAMTANAMAEDRAACLDAGMDDYLPKPIHLPSLAQALLDAARRRGITVANAGPRDLATESPESRAQRIGARILSGGGQMGELMRSIDWSQTPVGPPYTWPQSLRTALSILLAQRHPIFLWWGRELVQFYNDAYRPILGRTKHPRAMGQRGRECWAEIWEQVGPMADAVLNRGESSWVERGLLCLDRNGQLEECYFTYAYSPIRDESGEVGGVFVACSENTADVIGARRSALLLELDERAMSGATLEQQRARVAAAVHDLPFTLVYRIDEFSGEAHLAWSTGLEPGSPPAPARLRSDSAGWGVHECLRTQRALMIHPPATLPSLPPWPEPPRQALVHPLGRWGALVVGLSPRLIVDEAYRTFVFRLAQRLQRMSGWQDG